MSKGPDEVPADSIAAGGTTLIELLGTLADEGFGGQLIATDSGALRCVSCETTTRPDQFPVAGFERLEGASDPDDMNIVVWGHCPNCGVGGSVTIGYGPNSSDADQAALKGLVLDEVEDAGTIVAGSDD